MPKWIKKNQRSQIIEDDYDSVLDLLINYGANPYVEDNQGKTPLFLAVINNNHSIIRQLVDRGVGINYVTPRGTAVHYAVQFSTLETLKLLASLGADMNIEDAWDLTPLHLAVHLGKMDFVETLIDLGADPLFNSQLNSTPLLLAAQNDDIRAFQIYHRRGISFDIVDFLNVAIDPGKVRNYLLSIMPTDS